MRLAEPVRDQHADELLVLGEVGLFEVNLERRPFPLYFSSLDGRVPCCDLPDERLVLVEEVVAVGWSLTVGIWIGIEFAIVRLPVLALPGSAAASERACFDPALASCESEPLRLYEKLLNLCHASAYLQI
eukprot:6008715-Amphidinium_carterae.1